MRNFRYVFFLGLIVSLLFSCRKSFYYNLNTDKKIIVTGLLIANEPIFISVYHSHSINDTIYSRLGEAPPLPDEFIKNASVSIEDINTGEIVNLYYMDSIEYSGLSGNFSSMLYGYYTDSILPEEGHTYKLRVYVEGNEISAVTSIPILPDIDTAYLQVEHEDFITHYYLTFIFNDTNHCSEQNYYWVKLYNNNLYSTDPAVNAIGYQGILLSDSVFSCRRYPFTIEISSSDSIINIYSATEDFAKFMQTAVKQIYYTSDEYLFISPFVEPVVIYSNIKNAVGIFTGFSRPISIKLNFKGK